MRNYTSLRTTLQHITKYRTLTTSHISTKLCKPNNTFLQNLYNNFTHLDNNKELTTLCTTLSQHFTQRKNTSQNFHTHLHNFSQLHTTLHNCTQLHQTAHNSTKHVHKLFTKLHTTLHTKLTKLNATLHTSTQLLQHVTQL